MRIGLLTHQWPGVRLGGVGAYTLHCARALASAGHEAHVFTLRLPEDARRALPAGVVVHEAADVAQRVAEGSLPGALAAAVSAGGEGVYRLGVASILCDAVRRVHGETPLDVVEGPEYEALGLPLMVAPLGGAGGRTVPVVTHIHSGSAIARLSGNAGSAPSRRQSLIEALEFAAIAWAGGTCAASRRVLADTTEAYGSLPAEGTVLLPLPFVEEAAEFVAPPADGAVLYVGRLEFLKGAHLLAPAASAFLTRNPGATLRLAGPDTATAPEGAGSMAGWLRRQMAPEAASRVLFLGEQTRAQIREELRRCAFVVVPSFFDNFPYVCCEAMGAGRAIVVSEGIGAAEQVGPAGVTFTRGDAVALAEAMERMWRDAELRAQLGRVAYERMRGELSAENAIRRRVAWYEQVIAGPRRAGRAARLSGLRPEDAAAVVAALVEQTAYAAGAALPASGGVALTAGMRLTAVLESHAKETGRPAQALLYGAGRHTARLLAERDRWESRGHRVIGLIDDHPRFAEERVWLGLPVESTAAVMQRLPLAEGVAVVLSTDTFEEQFWERTADLRQHGVRVYRLYSTTKP